MKKYKLVISENQDKSLLDCIQYLDVGNRTQVMMCRFKPAVARPKEEEQQAIALLRREETACPTQ